MTPPAEKRLFQKPLLPGCGRPLDYKPKECDPDFVGDLFSNALSKMDISDGSVGLRTLTLREISMLQFMNRVTDEPDWFVQVTDDEAANQLKTEVSPNYQRDFSRKMADWCIAELRYLASLHFASPENPPPIVVYHGDVVKSDTAVSIELKHALQEAVNKFQESIPERLKDWHPGSDEKVLDLVHPSLCPLVYGRTRILSEGKRTTLDDCIELCGHSEIVDILPPNTERPENEMNGFSTKFQWLPCEVEISGESSKITSYINNLHPRRERDLYVLIERLIDAAIPLWNVTLAPLTDKAFHHQRRIDYSKIEYDIDVSEIIEESGVEYSGYRLEDLEDWVHDNRRPLQPEPEGTFRPCAIPSPSLDLKTRYGKRGLQVIVKLANIQLTPEQPNYEGKWHIEGHLNEHIIATAHYYYSCENTTPSTLDFRQICLVEDVRHDPEGETGWLTEIFGCKNWGGAIQHVGGVEIREGRLITFPNVVQNRVAPFKLADPTKPGHRKIVSLFLVDPNIKITSTAHVPCQQQEWWWETVMAVSPSILANPNKAVNKFPIEIQDLILEGVNFPFSVEEAKALRLELIKEQESFAIIQSETFEDTIIFAM